MKPITLILCLVALLVAPAAAAQTSIAGTPVVDAATLTDFVRRHNPEFNPAIASAFVEVGHRYGIRGDIALCQAIIETGWFRFDGGTAVTPDMHNYCGLGVTQRGSAGCSFPTVEAGVEAMLQHLYAYCCTDPLPEGHEVLDPRFSLVSRGSAPTWEALSGRWAVNPAYGANILAIYSRLVSDPALSALPAQAEAPIPELFD